MTPPRLRRHVQFAVAFVFSGSLALTACSRDEFFSAQSAGGTPAQSPLALNPGDERVSVFHFNLAGATENDGNLSVIRRIVSVISEAQPDIVSLNEICGQQNEFLLQQLGELGYQGNYARNNKNAVACGTNWSGGVAVYMLDAKPFSGDDFNKDNHNQIGQSTACITGTGERPVYACSTHLSARAKEAARESRRLRRVLPRKAGSNPLVVAGDFNLRPSHPAIDAMYARVLADGEDQSSSHLVSGFYEADMYGPRCGRSRRPAHRGACTWPHRNPRKKIDYIFVDAANFREVEGETRRPGSCARTIAFWRVGPRACSDHLQLWGAARLTTDASTHRALGGAD